MQRQSLGSPVSKLHGHGGPKEETLLVDEPKRKDLASSSSPLIDYDDRDFKAARPRRLSLSPPLSPTHSNPEKLIHLIPVLTLLCFLILYLSSHSPSQSDLAQFNGFKRPLKHLDSVEIGDVGRLIEPRRGDVLAIRSLRNLQEVEKRAPKSRSHRKTADF